MLRVVKMSLKGEVQSHALNNHGNYIVDHGKPWKNHVCMRAAKTGEYVPMCRHG